MNIKQSVSICIPTYNGAQYLRECLDSVLAQTWADYEVLLVDDQSTDETLEIAHAYAARDPRIRVLQNEHNLGLVGNWNRCIELAHGEWIKFVFQDDLIEPRCLELMIEAATGNQSIVCCRRRFIFEEGTDAQTRQYYETHLSLDTLFPKACEISAEDFGKAALSHIGVNFVGEPTAVMIHRSVFEKFGAFNPNLIMICDFEYWTRIAVHTGMTYVPQTLASFRVHQGSTSAFNFSARKYRIMLDALALLHDFVFLPVYAPLRLAAARQDGVDLMQRLAEETRGAEWVANHAAKNKENPDPALMNEWKQFLVRYPQLAQFTRNAAPQSNLLSRVWNSLYRAGSPKPEKVDR